MAVQARQLSDKWRGLWQTLEVPLDHQHEWIRIQLIVRFRHYPAHSKFLRHEVMASDAFFPFRDGIDAAVSAGITAVIQPGGSIRDKEIIQAVDEQQVAMILTGMRHFRH